MWLFESVVGAPPAPADAPQMRKLLLSECDKTLKELVRKYSSVSMAVTVIGLVVRAFYSSVVFTPSYCGGGRVLALVWMHSLLL